MLAPINHYGDQHDSLKKTFYLSALASLIIILTAHHLNGQSNTQPLTLRQGHSMYIVAFRQLQFPVILDPADAGAPGREHINYDLHAERKVRKRIEEWQYFRVAESRATLISSFL